MQLSTLIFWLPAALVLSQDIPVVQQKPLDVGTVNPRNHYLLTSVHAGKLKAAATAAASSAIPTNSNGALTCSKNAPCIDGSCCGANGICGFDPSTCGSGCQNNCGATAPCGRNSAGGSVKCGMNVCCSNSGWCGVTQDYCATGQYGCQQGFGSCAVASPPQCGGNSAGQGRKIGYYQGGNNVNGNSPCGRVTPSDIDTSKYTHLTWAFAEFDPNSFQIVSSVDGTYYQQFTALQRSGKLQTWIGIGGWDFTTGSPHAWSNMVSTAANRAKFINSLVSFMKQYHFQGVDIDWEYPVDSARGGAPQDMVNLVQLLADMRANSAFGHNFGISVTLAPDLWYLQHFDAKGLLNNADWLGFMSYDLHGVWDATDPVGNVVLGQTDINDIQRDMIPLWFDLSAADMSRINMGVALYGRGYTLSDPSCNRADGSCRFSGGSNPGPCTNAAGVLSNVEIRQIMKQRGLTAQPLQDGTSNSMMVQISWDNQWIGFDNADTIAQKTAYASSRCFGGMMFWSVDLDTTGTSSQSSLSPLPPSSSTQFGSSGTGSAPPRPVSTFKTSTGAGIPPNPTSSINPVNSRSLTQGNPQSSQGNLPPAQSSQT